MTGVTSGLSAGGINIPATIIAASNSYVWNKIWVFQKIDNKGFFADVPKFAFVTILGLVVNSVVIIGFTSWLDPVAGINRAAWLNIGKFIATLLGILVDFIGYKFLVFRKAK
jgi:putative flippase GtrA